MLGFDGLEPVPYQAFVRSHIPLLLLAGLLASSSSKPRRCTKDLSQSGPQC